MSRIGRTFPPQIGIPNQFGITQHALGPRAPQQRIPPLASPLTPGQLQVKVALAARNRRLTEVRRFPLPGFEQDPTQTTVAQAVLQDHVAGSNFGGTGLALGDSATDAAYGQQFALAAGTTTVRVKVTCKANGNPTDSLVAEIRTDSAGLPSNTVLASGSVLGSTIDNSGLVDITIPLSAASITGTVWLVLRRSGAVDAVNYYLLGLDNAASPEGPWSQFNGTSWGFTDPRAILSTLTVSVSTTAYVLPARFLGPQPPQLIRPLPTSQQTTVAVNLASGLFTNQRRAQQRRVRSRLFPPTVLALPPVVTTLSINPATGVLTNQRRAQQRRTSYDLRPPTVLRPPFVAAPINVNGAVDLLRRRYISTRRFPLQGWLGQGYAGGSVVDDQYGSIGAFTVSIAFDSTDTALGMPFTGDSGPLQAITIFAGTQRGVGAPTLVAIQNDVGGSPGGTVLASVTVPAASWVASGDNVISFAGSGLTLAAGTTYWVVLSQPGFATDTANGESWRANNLTPKGKIRDSAGVWADISTPSPTSFRFKVTTGTGAGTPPILVRRNLGVFPPLFTGVAPVVTTLSINTASGLLTNQRRMQQRRTSYDLRPPTAQPPPTLQQQTIKVALARTRPRPRTAYVDGPVLVAPAAPVVTTLNVNVASGLLTRQRRAQQRRTDYLLAPPAVAAAGFVAPPLSVNCLQPDRLSRRFRRQLPSSVIAPPTVLAPVSTAITVYPATGLLTNWRRAQQRRTSYRLARPVFYPATSEIAVTLVRARPRPTRKLLGAPATLAVFAGPAVNLLPVDRFNRKHRRGVSSALAPPTVVSTQVFAGPKVELVAVARAARPRPTVRLLAPPATLQPYSITLAEDTIRVALARTRPRRTTAFLGDYIVAPVVAAFYGPATHLVRTRPRPTVHSLTAVSYPATSRIAVSLVRTRPRPTRGVLAAPQALTVFAGPKVALVRTRPRPTRARLAAPTVIRVPSVEQAEQTIRVTLVRARPRPTRARLAPPQALQVFTGPTVRLVITRPRPTTTLLPGYVVAPVQAAFYGPVVKLVRARPRPTAHRLTAVTYPATSQIEARLVSTRPRPIRSRLAPPATLEPAAVAQAERTIRVTLVRTRPRPTVRELAPPATLEPESVALHERQILVSLTRTRPRPTTTVLAGPTVLQVFPGPTVALTRTRPRPTVRQLFPPATLESAAVALHERQILVRLVTTRPRPTTALLPGYIVAPVAAAFYGPQVELARIRPRPIRSRLAPPVTYPATSEILVALVRTRPRPTARLLFAPAAIRIPAVEQREQTITVALVRTRPRPTVRLLAAPQALAVFAGPRVTLVRTRPRPTVWTVRAPRVVRVPSVEQAEQTIRVTLVRARPRPTTTVLAAPTVVRVPTVEQREQTIAVTLVRTRPRPTVRELAPPTVIVTNPPLVTTLLPAKLQAIRGRLLHRPTHWRLAPPTAVIPLPGLRQQTITVRLVATRPRPTTTLLTPPTRLFPPQLLQRLSTIAVTLVRTRPRPTVRLLTGPSFPRPSLDQQTIGVTLTRIRPPRTSSRLAPPVFYRQTSEIAVRLVVTRPRPTVRELFPPTVIRERPVETLIRVHVVTTRPRPTVRLLAEPTDVRRAPVETTLTVTLVRARPRPTVRLLSPPTDVRRPPVETTVAVTLVRTRPRPTRARLALPAALRVFTGPRVSLTRTRPRPTTALLAAPSAILVPAVEQARRTITVALVQTRPRPTVRLLPLVVLAAPEVTQLRVTLVAARPRPPHSRLRPPAVVRIVPPTLTQQTIRVTLAVAARVGLLYLRVKSTLPPSPVPPIIPHFGWTDGYTTATDGTAGVQEPLTATTGDQEPTASTQSDVSPVAESTGMTEALYFTDGEIEIGGS